MIISIKKSIKLITLAMLLSVLTACGGGGGGNSSPAAGTVPLTTAVIQLAQDTLDVITTVIDGATGAFDDTDLQTLQTAFDGLVTIMSGGGGATAITALDIQAVQDELDDYTGTVDASAGALSAEDIQAAQDALDAATPIV